MGTLEKGPPPPKALTVTISFSFAGPTTDLSVDLALFWRDHQTPSPSLPAWPGITWRKEAIKHVASENHAQRHLNAFYTGQQWSLTRRPSHLQYLQPCVQLHIADSIHEHYDDPTQQQQQQQQQNHLILGIYMCIYKIIIIVRSMWLARKPF